jgi:hypothetical protein
LWHSCGLYFRSNLKVRICDCLELRRLGSLRLRAFLCNLRAPEGGHRHLVRLCVVHSYLVGQGQTRSAFRVVVVLFPMSHLAFAWESAGLFGWFRLLAFGAAGSLLALLVGGLGGVCLSLVSHSEVKGGVSTRKGGMDCPHVSIEKACAEWALFV